ncbi:MAG: hypothetical protein RL662_2093 [Bacteroidota bacterium]|jgi:uncharacterized membrane protein required for colicin V production
MNGFDIFVLIVVAYSILTGYRSGLAKQLASLGGLIASILLSGKVSTILSPHLKDIIPNQLLQPVTFLIAFLLITIAFWLIGYMLQNILETIKMGTINKLAGAGLSCTKWIIAISILLNIVVAMDKKNTLIPADMDTRSKSYKYIKPIAPAITPYLRFEIPKIID